MLSSTALGSSVTSSSLTSVGTLSTLTVSGDVTITGTLDVQSHDGDSKGLKLGSTLVKASAVELNKLASMTSSAAELNLLNTAVPGTVVNSKAVIYSAQGNIKATTYNIEKEFSSTNTVENLLTLTRTTSGTSIPGIGVGLTFESENGAGATVEIAKIEGTFTNVGDGSEVGSLAFKTRNGNSMDTSATLDSTGLNLKSGAVYKINNTEVLSSTALGSSVTSSSLTSVGTLTSLTLGGKLTMTGGNIEHTDSGSDFSIVSQNKNVVIEGVIFDGSAISGVSTIDASGDITLSSSTDSTNPTSGALVVTGGVGIGGTLNVAGNITTNDNLVQASDKRWKKNIRPILHASTKLQQVRGVFYDFRTDEFPEKRFPASKQIGVVAQELEAVFPDAVDIDADGFKGVQYGKISAILIAAVNEQSVAIDHLQSMHVAVLAFLTLITLLLIPCALVGCGFLFGRFPKAGSPKASK